MGGWVCFEFARVGEGGGEYRVMAYEVKKTGGKLHCLLLLQFVFYVYEISTLRK